MVRPLRPPIVKVNAVLPNVFAVGVPVYKPAVSTAIAVILPVAAVVTLTCAAVLFVPPPDNTNVYVQADAAGPTASVFAVTAVTGPEPFVRATQPACVGVPSVISPSSVVSIPNTPNYTFVRVALM